jgi:hypothetical protein
MRHEKTILPPATQQKHNHSHRVSLLFIQCTQQATMQASPMSGPRTMQASLISDSGWINLRVGRFSKSNSNSHGRPGSTVNSHPTDRITDGLGVGVTCGYIYFRCVCKSRTYLPPNFGRIAWMRKRAHMSSSTKMPCLDSCRFFFLFSCSCPLIVCVITYCGLHC